MNKSNKKVKHEQDTNEDDENDDMMRTGTQNRHHLLAERVLCGFIFILYVVCP